MSIVQPKQFNIAGPCVPTDHYMLPALPRLLDISGLIAGKNYFVLHAPRQSGKTTVMKAAVDHINEDGSYHALYCSLAKLREITDVPTGMRKLIAILDDSLITSRFDDLRRSAADVSFWVRLKALDTFKEFPVQIWLRALSSKLDKDLIVFFDEADCLEDMVLLSFLTQLRDGYVDRNDVPFPRSIALIGMRNIRDYKAKTRDDSKSLGSASPFNIITEALTIADFSQAEIKTLYTQHTEASGQVFEDGALQRAWYWSEGQPWLVNALARQAVEKILLNNYSQAITADHIDQAADNLMRRRDTHIDSLLERLKDHRVSRFIEPMLAASERSALVPYPGEKNSSFNDDLQYCLDLGLVKIDDVLRPANPIYASVMARSFNENIQRDLPGELTGKWMDGKNLDMTGLLKAFQEFWVLNSEKYLAGMTYVELGPHMLLSAFLQRVVNGGGLVFNEYANGWGYADIAVKYAGRSYPIELKIKENQRSRAESREQLLRYMDHLLAKEGWLVVFDRESNKSWPEKITWETELLPTGQVIHVVGC